MRWGSPNPDTDDFCSIFFQEHTDHPVVLHVIRTGNGAPAPPKSYSCRTPTQDLQKKGAAGPMAFWSLPFHTLLAKSSPQHLAVVAEVQNLNFTGKTKFFQSATFSSFSWVILHSPWIGVIPVRCKIVIATFL